MDTKKKKIIGIVDYSSMKGLFVIRLFCWNWNFFAESTVNKGKS